MKSGKTRTFIAFIFPLAMVLALGGLDHPRAEMVHLKDGQVLSGYVIVKDKDTVVVKTNYMEKTVKKVDILKIEEVKKVLEPLYILTTKGDTIKGFLVEQDARQVVYKLSVDAAEDKTISKLHIKKMSKEEFRPVDLEFFIRPGAFFPLESGGSNLNAAPAYLVGVGANSMFVRWMRIELEAGYVKSESGQHGGQYLQVLPVVVYAACDFILPFYRTVSVVPRLGFGLAMLEYDDGEGVRTSGNALDLAAGFSVNYCVIRNFIYAGIWSNYSLIYDGSGTLRGVSAGISGILRL